MTLIFSTVPCAAWSSCGGIKHCPTVDSCCQCFALCYSTWCACRGTKHCPTIDSYCQCFTLCCMQRYKALSEKWLLFSVLYLVLHGPLAEVQSTVSQLTLYVSGFTLCCMVLLQRYKALSHSWLLLSVLYLVLMVLLQWYKALSHNWLLLSVLYLVLHGPLVKVQSTVSQLILFVSALPCAAWSSCKGTVQSTVSHCQCFTSCCMDLAEVQSTVSQLTLEVSALPCAAWSSCRGTKYCPTIDPYSQCFILCCMVLLQRYKELSHNWPLFSVLYLVLHGPLAEVQSTVP